MKVAVVTGANRGLGLEFVKELLARGYKVFATYRKLAEFPKQDNQNLIPIHLDLANESSVIEAAKEIREKTDSIDLLINNAGIYLGEDGLNTVNTKDALHVYQINAVGHLQFTRELLSVLSKAKSKVIAISSGYGSIASRTRDDEYLYSMSKAALNMAFHNLAVGDCAGKNLKIAIFSPGWMHTDMGGAEAPIDPADSARKILDIVEAGKFESGVFLDTDGKTVPW